MNEERKLDEAMLEQVDGGAGLLEIGVHIVKNDDFNRIMNKKSEMLQKQKQTDLLHEDGKDAKKK